MLPRLRRQEGFTVIEVLIAALILTVAIAAAMVTLTDTGKISLVTERSTTINHLAQSELERVLSLPYSQVALTGTSSSWSSTSTDYTYVGSAAGDCPGSPTGPAPTYRPDHSSAGSSATEPLVLNGCSYTTTVGGTPSTITPLTGAVAPVTPWSAPLQNGTTVSGNIYDFVTWAADPSCGQTATPGSACDTSKDYKRVVVVVTLAGASEPAHPAIVSGYVIPPNQGKNPCSAGATGCGGTSCNNGQGQSSCSTNQCPGCTGITEYPCDSPYSSSSCGQPPCPGNTLHDTLVAVGVTPAAPDLMETTPPTGSCTSGTPPTPTPPCFATSPGCGGGGGGCGTSCGGLPITPTSGTTCGSPPASNTQSHSWVTAPIPAGATWNLTGTGDLTTYLESSSGTTVQATLCMGLYVVPGGVLGALTGNLLAQPIGTTFSADVQATAGVPTPVTVNFNVGSGTYAVASLGQTRIEMVLWVVGTTTPVDVVYDQVGYAAQMTLNTTT